MERKLAGDFSGLTLGAKKSVSASIHRTSDLLLSVVAFVLLFVMSTMVAGAELPDWEVTLFRSVNNLPDFLFPVIWPFMQYGVFVTIPFVATVALLFKRVRLATLLLLGGIGIYFLARYVKVLVPRGRPDALLDAIQAREKFAPGSSGFTSGHTAVASTIATFAHYYLKRHWQIISIVTLAIVAFGRMYIGGHLPLDVFGGIALGVGVASLLNFIVGVPHTPVRHHEDTRLWIAAHRPRHPGDLIRMFIAAVVFGSLSFLVFGGQLSQLEEAIFRVINYLPSFLSPIVQLIMQSGALFFVFIAAAVALVLKHYRLAIKSLFGGVTVWWLARVAKEFISRDRPFYLLESIVQRATNSGILGFPSGHAAVAGLLATIWSPYLAKPWRRVIWTMAWITALSRVYVGAHLPLDVFAGLALGWFLGSLLNFSFGTPAKILPIDRIKRRLSESNLKVASVEQPELDARGSTPLFATTENNRSLFIKYFDNEHRNADLLYKLWRYILLRTIEDEAPFATAKQIAEHEAYVSIQAHKAKVRTPDILTVSSIDSHSSMLVSKRVKGKVLSSYKGVLDTQLISEIWRQVKVLHEHRIAHRDLRAANIMIDHRKMPWLIDFSYSVTSASDGQLQRDILELLVSLSMRADPGLVVTSAIKVLGADLIVKSMPYLQPVSLTRATRKEMHKHADILSTIRSEVSRITHKRLKPRARMHRVNYQWALFVGLIGLSMYYLLPQLGELDTLVSTLKNGDVHWLGTAIIFSVLTYVASAFVVLGSTEKPVSFASVLLLQGATTAVNRVTPKGVGGIALTEQFFERNDATPVQATTSVFFIYAAGIITHLLLLLGALLIVDLGLISIVSLSAAQLALLGVVVAFVVFGIVMVPKLRKLFTTWKDEFITGLRHRIRHPIKLFQLFGGSLLVTVFYALALYATLEGFGSAIAFNLVLLVYLAGSAMSAAAPTPSGLGAAEAALVVGLTAVSVPIEQAVAGVLTFRLITFWLPIVPGIVMFRSLTRHYF